MQHNLICSGGKSPKSPWTITRIRLGIAIIANPFANKNLRNEKNYRYLLLLTLFGGFGNSQNIRLNLYSAYAFEDRFDSYYDQYNYYDGQIQAAVDWGMDWNSWPTCLRR